MAVTLNAYINFVDEARAAMQFYQQVFGGELTMQTFAEGGMPHDPAEADKLMHARLDTPNGLILMAADTPVTMARSAGSNVSLSLSGDDADLLQGYFEKLADGGTVTMPLERAPWGDLFGMCVDRYGMSWLVNIALPTPPSAAAVDQPPMTN